MFSFEFLPRWVRVRYVYSDHNKDSPSPGATASLLHELSVKAMEAKKIGGKPDEAPTELKRSTHLVQAEKVSSLTASARSRYFSEAMLILGGVHLADLSSELRPQLRGVIGSARRVRAQ